MFQRCLRDGVLLKVMSLGELPKGFSDHCCFGVAMAMYLVGARHVRFWETVEEIQTLHASDVPDLLSGEGTDFLSETHQAQLKVSIEACEQSVLNAPVTSSDSLHFVLLMILKLGVKDIYHVLFLTKTNNRIEFTSTVGRTIGQKVVFGPPNAPFKVPNEFLGAAEIKCSSVYQLHKHSTDVS